ncbi:hypothetical protein BDW22DRAFT_1430856 [Trametopsis cervina]|nr:hypothetical protein BDW22DRAFT_1430856 [Trametopsis cervina]
MSNNKRKPESKIPKSVASRTDVGTTATEAEDPAGKDDVAAPGAAQGPGTTYPNEATKSDRGARVDEIGEEDAPARETTNGPVTRSRSRASSTSSTKDVQAILTHRPVSARLTEPRARSSKTPTSGHAWSDEQTSTNPDAVETNLAERGRLKTAPYDQPARAIEQDSIYARSNEQDTHRARSYEQVTTLARYNEQKTVQDYADAAHAGSVEVDDLEDMYYDPENPEELGRQEAGGTSSFPYDSASRRPREPRGLPRSPPISAQEHRALNSQTPAQAEARMRRHNPPALPTVPEVAYTPAPPSKLAVLDDIMQTQYYHLRELRDEIDELRAQRQQDIETLIRQVEADEDRFQSLSAQLIETQREYSRGVRHAQLSPPTPASLRLRDDIFPRDREGQARFTQNETQRQCIVE